METLEQLKARIETAAPGAQPVILANASPANQPSLLLDREHARAVAQFLRDDPALAFDYASNVTGVDWPGKGCEKNTPAFLEAVYHLYSMSLKHGPLIVRMRTENRTDRASLPSLTPVWRSCEFQEREIFDLYGIVFEGHPDLRRLLMWPEFTDHPMRKDYVEPDDYEYEPTPHDAVLSRARQHQPGGAQG